MTNTHSVRSLTRGQKAFLLFCFFAWCAFALYAPESVSVDVYFFRDAACNWVLGHGFRTASLEKSVSFTPVLYSSYPPLSQWAFIPFAEVFGCTWRAASVHTIVLAALGNWFVLSAGLRAARTEVQRWVLAGLVGLTLPLGFLLAETDRPEELTFLLLAILFWSLSSSRQTLVSYAGQGLLAGLAFLSEPFGGVLGVLAIAGAALARALGDAPSGEHTARGLRAGVLQAVLSAVFFALPLGLTVAAFQAQDATALARFEKHARLAGTDRAIDYSMSADTNDAEAHEPKASFTRKIKLSIAAQAAKGPIYQLQFLGWLATVFIGAALAFSGTWRRSWPVWAVLVIGLILPFLAFPMQENYHTLGEAVVPLAPALGWAGWRAVSARERSLLWSIFVVQLLCLLPNALVQLVYRWDTRQSAMHAVTQAKAVEQYLRGHRLEQKVLMVPNADYYFYKPEHANLYNPNYYSKREGMDAVGGAVTCKTSTLDFSKIPVSPAFPGNWGLIAEGGAPVAVTLLHRQVMHRNWSAECDVFVRRTALTEVRSKP